MHKIAILYDASQAVLSTFDVDEALKRILTILRDYFHLRSGAILLLDKDSNSLTVRTGINRPEIGTVKIPMGKGITGRAARCKRPIYSPDVSRDPRYINGDPTTRSEVAVPLIVRDEVVGVLDCQSDRPHAFDDEIVDLLTLFASNAAIALQNCELSERERRRTAQLEAINSIAKQTTAAMTVAELLEAFCTRIPCAFPVDHVAAFLLESENRLVLRRQAGSLRCTIQEGEQLAGAFQLTAADSMELRAHMAGGGRCEGVCEGAGSELHLPLVSFGEKLGFLSCSSVKEKAFGTGDIESLESMADIIATSVQNAAYVDKLRGLVNVDGLTQIFNRRFFEDKVPEKIAEASRYGGSLSLLMIDIDKFKSINDDFGHLLGDEVLKQVSLLLKGALRKVDLLCRYGGEELAVIAPATAAKNALALGEKLRKAVAEHSFPGIPRSVTVSIGVAEYPVHGASRDALVGFADAALYRAKEAGRNRVMVAELEAELTTNRTKEH